MRGPQLDVGLARHQITVVCSCEPGVNMPW